MSQTPADAEEPASGVGSQPLAEGVLRPRDFALLLLAAGQTVPRKRAREQQTDRIGLERKRQILDAVVDLDPEPEDLEAALLVIVEELGPPTGPTRSVASSVLDEWRAACVTPAWVDYLLGEALRGPEKEGQQRGRQLPA